MAVTVIGNKLQVEVLADESTKTQLNEIRQEVGDLDSRVDTILTTPAESVSAQEIIDARQGEASLGANITEVKSQLADNSTQIRQNRLGYDALGKTEYEILSLFGTDSNWTKVGTTGTVTDDIVNHQMSDKGLKVEVINGESASIKKTINIIDLRNKILTFNIFVTSAINLDRLWLYFSSSEVLVPSWIRYYPVDRIKDGWNKISIPIKAFETSNSATDTTWKNTIHMYFSVKSKTGTTCAVTFDSVSHTPSLINRGKIVLAFDDGAKGVYTLAKPLFDARGYKGVVYAIADIAGVEGYMTVDELKSLYDSGWDIGTHGQVSLPTLDETGLRSDFSKNYNFLVKNGMGKSAIHYASHQGGYNDLAIKIMKEFFYTHRTTRFEYLTLPTTDRYLLPNVGGNNASITQLKAYVDVAASQNVVAIINFHKISNSDNGIDTYVANLEALLDYIATKNVDVVTLSDIFDSDKQNLLLKDTLQAKNGNTTAMRPTLPTMFECYFDVSLNKPIWFNGTVWVDSAGETV